MAISGAQRRQRYFDCNSRLAQLDDDQLRALVGEGDAGDGDSSRVVLLGREQLFVKRIPVTQVEYYPVIRLMQEFFAALGRNNRKNATYSQTALRRLLRRTGFIN